MNEKYDGIWACASILHLPKKELKEVFKKMLTALKPGGRIYTSFKYGEYEGERNGRYFTDFTACADTSKPVKQGMFGIFEVFADTIVICTLTALVILVSGVPVNYGAAAGAELTISGFTATYGGWVSIFTAVAMEAANDVGLTSLKTIPGEASFTGCGSGSDPLSSSHPENNATAKKAASVVSILKIFILRDFWVNTS